MCYFRGVGNACSSCWRLQLHRPDNVSTGCGCSRFQLRLCGCGSAASSNCQHLLTRPAQKANDNTQFACPPPLSLSRSLFVCLCLRSHGNHLGHLARLLCCAAPTAHLLAEFKMQSTRDYNDATAERSSQVEAGAEAEAVAACLTHNWTTIEHSSCCSCW